MNTPDLTSQISGLLLAATEAYLDARGGEVREAVGKLEIELQRPRNPEHGDWAAPVAMRLAKPLRANPFEVAEGIAALIPSNDVIDPPEAVRPGFINIRLAAPALGRVIRGVLSEGEAFGRSDARAGERVLVEFVSANPTGPLHVGHGRNAIIGDTLARVLEAAGCQVEREYYYNDAGVQMNMLGRSLRIRYLQELGESVEFPEDGYKGDYMKEIARALAGEIGDSRRGDEDLAFFSDYAAGAIMKEINADLERLGIRFDRHFSETTLHKAGKVDEVLEVLREKGVAYENEGALWLRSSDFGDEKDRVLRKSDGNKTYLTPDIAYHRDKFERGHTRLINVLGGDHHGYVLRLRAAVQALGYDPARLNCILIQMVSVLRGGEIQKLSTRAGDFIPLSEILDELGPEVVRFFYLLRSPDSQMVFDTDLARQQSRDNPYWYLQYAHARCCSIMAKAADKGVPWTGVDGSAGGADAPDLSLLGSEDEKAVVVQISRMPGVILAAAGSDDPMQLVQYLRDLATAFHSWYSAGDRNEALRCVVPGSPQLTRARLALVAAFRQAMANGMRILGLTPIDRLENREAED